MECLQLMLLLLSLVSAVHCCPEPEVDQPRHVKREENVSLDDLQTLLQQQELKIYRLQSDLTTFKNQENFWQNRFDAFNNWMDSYKNQLDSYSNKMDFLKNKVDCKSQMNSYKSQMDTLKSQVDSYKCQMDSYESQMDTLRSQMDSYKIQVDSMETELQAVQSKADAASESVAFTARISHSKDEVNSGMALSHHQTVIFDDVVTNVGEAYNDKTSIFTAPVNGTYVFFLSQMNPNNRPDLYLAIVKDGAALDLVYSQGPGDAADQGSSQVTTSLTAGDQVWVRQHSGSGVRASFWTVFTGFLLHAD